ncbi:hypothetical protein Hanom_Chr03g00181581 [Helianthus anomalus]
MHRWPVFFRPFTVTLCPIKRLRCVYRCHTYNNFEISINQSIIPSKIPQIAKLLIGSGEGGCRQTFPLSLGIERLLPARPPAPKRTTYQIILKYMTTKC